MTPRELIRFKLRVTPDLLPHKNNSALVQNIYSDGDAEGSLRDNPSNGLKSLETFNEFLVVYLEFGQFVNKDLPQRLRHQSSKCIQKVGSYEYV